jgi:hypothetical protein
MTQEEQYGKWTENELQMTVAVYRKADCGLNECSSVYRVPKATVRRHSMMQIWYVNGVKALGRQATFFGGMDKILADYIIMLEECFFGGAWAEH